MPLQMRTENELTLVAEGQGVMFTKLGAMVAYQGQFKFEKVLLDPNGGSMVGAVINSLARRFTGENMPLAQVTGQGNCYFADRANHVVVINLDQGQSIGVESENLLGFNDQCQYGIRPIGVGVVSQKGLFTSKITGKGFGAQVAILSNGNPIILQTPCVVDPDAVICWTGADPSFKLDLNWKTFIGQASGESYMLEFKNAGETVIIQPYEREGGIKVGIDDGTQPQMQGGALPGGLGGMLGGGGSPGGGIGGMLGGLLNR